MNDADERSPSFAVTAVAFEGALAIAAVAVGWLIGFSPVAKLPFSADDAPRILPQIAWGVLASAPMFAGLWIVERIRWDPLERIGRLAQRIVVPLLSTCSLADLAMIALMAGIGEEVLFRGLIQAGLAHWVGAPYGMWIALAIASIVFGLAHAITRTYVLLAVLAGAYLGVLFILTDSLLPPIIAHAVYDFGALVYLLRGRDRADGEKPEA